MHATFVYTERIASGDYAIPPLMRPMVNRERVIVVDDAINAGVATLSSVEALERHGARIVAIGSVIVRTPGTLAIWAEREIPVEYLVGMPWNTWPVDECPLCQAGVPIDS